MGGYTLKAMRKIEIKWIIFLLLDNFRDMIY